MEHAQGAAGRLPGARAWRRPHGGEGEARSTPGGSAREGDGNREEPTLRAKATEPGGQRLRWGRARAGIATHLGAALGLLLAGKGLEPQNPDSVLYVPSHHPKQIKQRERSEIGGQTGPPGQTMHLPGNPSNSQWELIYPLPSFRPGRCLPAPLDQQGDP